VIASKPKSIALEGFHMLVLVALILIENVWDEEEENVVVAFSATSSRKPVC